MDEIKNLKIRYRNRRGENNNIGDLFLRPCLQEFSRWRRCSLGFNSSALKTWAGSLVKIVKSENRKIEILCDIYASGGDKQLMLALEHCSTEAGKIETLRRYQEDIIITAFGADQSGGNSEDFKKKYGWKLLHYLLAKGQLEIKFAINTISDGPLSNIYHEKAGYFEFPDGSLVGHEGSFNESDSGHRHNNESVSVFSSFRAGDEERLKQLVSDVNEDWEGSDSVHVLPLSPETLEIIKKNAPISLPKPDFDPSEDEENVKTGNDQELAVDPKVKKKWEHQEKALRTFLYNENNEYSIDENLILRSQDKYKGILSMATGTGKTSTALKIAQSLFESRDITKVLIIPNKTNSLCQQWYESVSSWKRKHENLRSLKIFRYYKPFKEIERFVDAEENAVLINKRDVKSTSYILRQLEKDKTLIICDEVHGFGAPSLQQLRGMLSEFKYTLGLSATPEREYDEEGTEFINTEIGNPIFSYPVEDAIKNGTLCPFNYHEIKVKQSTETSQKIHNAVAAFEADNNPNRSQRDLAITIASIRATDENKLPSLKYFFQNEQPELVKNSIIFCATHEQGKEVGDALNNIGATFTLIYEEDRKEQQLSLDDLAKGRIDTVVNCHTLSEGIDIRSLENIFILSSYRSKLETIQRVGRCLRMDPNKPDKIANIVDLVLYKDITSGDIIEAEKLRKDWLTKVSKVRENG